MLAIIVCVIILQRYLVSSIPTYNLIHDDGFAYNTDNFLDGYEDIHEIYTLTLPEQDISLDKNNEDSYFHEIGSVISIRNDSEVQWGKLMDFLGFKTKSVVQAMDLENAISGVNISGVCRRSLKAFIVSLSEWERWAVMMADASGKLPGGILEGSVLDMGSMDECLKIRVPSSVEGGFRGRYCMVGYQSTLLETVHEKEDHVKPPEWIQDFIRRSGKYLDKMRFYLGTCVPSTCYREDVIQITSQVVRPLGLKVHVPSCQVDESKPWTINTIVAMAFIGLVGVLCLIGTITDIISRYAFDDLNTLKNKYIILYLLRTFSLYLNSEKFFARNEKGNCLSFFNGMRFLSFIWVVINHTWAIYDDWRLLSYRDFLKFNDEATSGNITFKIIESAHVAVDTFFMISGFLLVYTTWKKLELSRGRLNVFRYMIQKYVRLTPSLGITIAIFVIVNHFSSGPIYNASMAEFAERCSTQWWQNFLYINNWWRIDDMCLPHTWFLSALMQSHLIGVLLLLMTHRYPLFGITIGSFIAVGSCILLALINIWNNHPMPTFLLLQDLDFKYDFLHKVHFQTYSHINSYLVGMVVGFLFLKFNDRKIATKYKVYGWTLAAVVAFYVFEGKYTAPEDKEYVAFYSATHRTAWALCIGWVAYICAVGHGGIVNRCLSWLGFQRLSNISYLAYLLHILVICYRNSTLRERFAYGEMEMVFEIVLVTVVGCFLSVIAYITVEMPFSTMTSLIFKR